MSRRRRPSERPNHTPRRGGVPAPTNPVDSAPTPPPRVTREELIGIGALTVCALAFHVLSQSHRPLWLDEACTCWTTGARGLDIVRGLRTDGTPPLYFLLVSAITKVVGASELALRSLSIVAATLLVPVVYLVTRQFASTRHALIASALVAVSPLVHFYAIQARPYALVQLGTVLLLGLAYHAAQHPRSIVTWGLLALLLFLQLWTHNYAVFLLVCPLWAAWWAGQPRRAAFMGAAAVIVGVLALDTPWLLRTMATEVAGVGDWIQSYWTDLPPSAALVRSVEVFVGGVQYPPYLDYLVLAPSLPGLSVSVGVGLLCLAVVRRQDDARV